MPLALLDFGIKCVISTQFGDIFYNNCFKNGVLPIKVAPEDLEKLFDDADRGANATLSIDLEAQEIRGPDGGVIKFDIDPFRKHCLLNGLDDIGSPWSRPTRSGPTRNTRRRHGRGPKGPCGRDCACGPDLSAGVRPATRFDAVNGCERLGAVKFKRHDPAFHRFVIDRATVEVDKFADRVGNQFVSTVYRGKAVYEAAAGPKTVRFICLHGGPGRGRCSSTRWGLALPGRGDLAAAILVDWPHGRIFFILLRAVCYLALAVVVRRPSS